MLTNNKRWHLQRLTATVSPSPTVSMLRSMRSSKCSFLLRVSRTKEVTSPATGWTTFPPHSTCERNEEYFTPSEHLCTSVCGIHWRYRWRWRRPSEPAAGTSRSSGRSWIYRHQWTQSRRFRPRLLLSAHLGDQKDKFNPKNLLRHENKSTYSTSATPTDVWSQFYVQLQPVEKESWFLQPCLFDTSSVQLPASLIQYFQDFRETLWRLCLWRKCSHLFEKRFGDVDVHLLYLAGHHPSIRGHRQGHAQGVVASVHPCRGHMEGQTCPTITAAGHHSHHKMANNGGPLNMLFLVLLCWIIMEKWFNCVALSNEEKYKLPISIALVAFISLMRSAINWACSVATIIPLQGSSKVRWN